jgi:hypothetical protein
MRTSTDAGPIAELALILAQAQPRPAGPAGAGLPARVGDVRRTAHKTRYRLWPDRREGFRHGLPGSGQKEERSKADAGAGGAVQRRYAILEAPSALGHVPEHLGEERASGVLLEAGPADGLHARRAGCVPAHSGVALPRFGRRQGNGARSASLPRSLPASGWCRSLRMARACRQASRAWCGSSAAW